jgi:hypothetical protein
MRKQASRLLFGYLASSILLLVAILAGCGVTSTSGNGSAPLTGSSATAASGQPTSTGGTPSSTPAGSTGSAPQLTCVLVTTVHPIDSLDETLHCTVAHVPSSETAFVLRFTAPSNAGPYTFSPACQGTLSDGSGACTVSFSGFVPFKIAKGTVAGATMPNHYALGPVVPIQVAGTPTGSPPLVPLITPTALPSPRG